MPLFTTRISDILLVSYAGSFLRESLLIALQRSPGKTHIFFGGLVFRQCCRPKQNEITSLQCQHIFQGMKTEISAAQGGARPSSVLPLLNYHHELM